MGGSHVHIKQNGTVLVSISTITQTLSLPKIPEVFQRSTISLKIVGALAENIRGNNKTLNQKPSYNSDQAISLITREDSTWNGKHKIGQPAIVTYSFDKWAEYSGYDQLTAKQQQQARIALLCWADVANITFVEKNPEEPTHINFGNYYKISGQAFAYLPNSGDQQGQCWFNAQNHPENLSPYPGNYGRLVFMHETGHAIGLSHPGYYNATSDDDQNERITWNKEENLNYWVNAIYAEDTRQYSVMSYWAENFTGADFHGYYAYSPLIDDIAALQRLYGPNKTRTEDNTYGFNSNTNKDWYTISDPRIGCIFSVWDAGGNDTLDFSGYFKNQLINLNSGSFSDVGGWQKNVSIARDVIVENAIGGAGHDVIIGNNADNTIKGGSGDDVIYGGLGQDTLWGGNETIRLNNGTTHRSFHPTLNPIYNIETNNSESSDQEINSYYEREPSFSMSDRSGKDTFVYLSFEDSIANKPDHIMDFQTKQDKIDLSHLHKDLHDITHGQYSLKFVNEFNGRPGEIKIIYNSENNLSEVFIDKDGDSNADFAIDVHDHVNPETDFIFN